MLYLGAIHDQPSSPVSQHIVRMNHSSTTHAYAINKSVFQYVLDTALESGKHIDMFYCNYMHPEYRCYCVEPRIVIQRPGYRDILQRNTDRVSLFR